MSSPNFCIQKVLLGLLGVFVMVGALQPQYAEAAEDGTAIKFKDTDPKPPERYKLDNTADGKENVRVIELLKKYAQEYTPIPVSDDTINTIDFTVGARNWHFGYGRKYFMAGYETAVSFYVNQARNDLNDYQLAIKTTEEAPTSADPKIYDDLDYTLTSFGISGSLYYLSSEKRQLSLGFELALLGVSQLTIKSEEADKTYSSNGFALLGYPVWRHTNLIPLKVRYQPLHNIAIQFAVHYVHYGIWQETTRIQGGENANAPGEWFQGCDAELCSESEVFPSLGIQVLF